MSRGGEHLGKRGQEWWDEWFIGLAKYVSTASKDPSTQVGAVLVDSDKRVVSIGYNGFPKDVEDAEERLNDRVVKLKMTIHAEMNAILFSERQIRGCTIYSYPFMPCSHCATTIIQKGIKRVVAPYSENPRWKEDFDVSRQMFEEAKLELVLLGEPKPIEAPPIVNDWTFSADGVPLNQQTFDEIMMNFDKIKIQKKKEKKWFIWPWI